MPTQPLVVVLGGPNGAGKSTAASRLLPAELTFINADEVAKRLPKYPSTAADLEAARLVLQAMDELEQRGADFAVETTLAGRSLVSRVTRLRSLGYFFRLIFVWAPSVEYAIRRVADRVRMGGHDIPEETIRRRYMLGLKNFFQLYRPLADHWGMYSNTETEGFRIIAEGRGRDIDQIVDPELWDRIREGVANDG